MSAQQQYRDQAVQLANHAATVVDSELNQLVARLDGLARSSAVEQANFSELYLEARRLVAGTPEVIELSEFGGAQIFNTEVEFGRTLPPRAEKLSDEERAKLMSQRVHISDVYPSPSSGEPRIAVARPLTLRRGVPLLIAVTVPTTEIYAVLAPAIPAGWVVGVGDKAGVYVTRSARHDQVSGKPGLAGYLNKAIGPSGTFTATNQFGETLLAGYVRSDLSGWLFGANVPLSMVEAPLWRSLYGILGIGLVALLLSLLLAYWIGKQLTKETAALSARAMSLGAGLPVPPLNTRLAEFAVVGEAFLAAQAMLRKRTSELAAVLETVPAAVWFTYDKSARQVIRNRYAAELMGVVREEDPPFGAADEVVETVAFQDGREISRDERPLTRAMRGEHTDREEFTYYVPNGAKVILLSSARPIYDPAGQEIIGAVQISLDISERKRAEEQRQLLTWELDHRVKNNLAIIQALANQTLRTAASLPEASAVLGARLAALGRAHAVLARNSWTESGIREAIEASVLVQAPAGRVELAGPGVALSPRLVMAMSLAMHELTTNAIKYGALSEGGGRVAISWAVSEAEGKRLLTIDWRELGGPGVAPPGRTGFGSRLLKEMAASEGGSVELSFDPAGLHCALRFTLTA